MWIILPGSMPGFLVLFKVIRCYFDSYTTRRQSFCNYDEVISDPAYQGISAIEEERVYYTPANSIGWDPAIGVLEVHYLAKLFYPEMFSDLDVEKEGNKILEKFYGVEGLYTDFLEKSDLHRWE